MNTEYYFWWIKYGLRLIIGSILMFIGGIIFASIFVSSSGDTKNVFISAILLLLGLYFVSQDEKSRTIGICCALIGMLFGFMH